MCITILAQLMRVKNRGRASETCRALEAAHELAGAGIDFVCIPVLSNKDKRLSSGWLLKRLTSLLTFAPTSV